MRGAGTDLAGAPSSAPEVVPVGRPEVCRGPVVSVWFPGPTPLAGAFICSGAGLSSQEAVDVFGLW